MGQGLFLVDGRGVEAYDDFVLEPPCEVDSWFRGRILGRVAAEDDADGAVADPSEEREDGSAGSESRRVGAVVCGCGCGDKDREGDEDYRRARQWLIKVTRGRGATYGGRRGMKTAIASYGCV